MNSTHTHEVTGAQVRGARAALAAYLDRFKTRLSLANAQRVQLAISVMDKLVGTLAQRAGVQAGVQTPHGGGGCAAGAGGMAAGVGGRSAAGGGGGGFEGGSCVVRANDFLCDCQLDGVNFFELLVGAGVAGVGVQGLRFG